MSDHEYEGGEDDREQGFAGQSGQVVRLRPHALFPRPPGAGPENRDIQFVGIQRKLPPAEAKRVGHKIEYCPEEFPADDLPDWAAIHARFGGGQYKVCAKDSNRQIICWSPAGDGNWYYMAGRSKRFMEDGEPEDEDLMEPPARVAAAPAGPTAPTPATTPPSFDLANLMLGLAKMHQESADRQMHMHQESATRQMQMMAQMSDNTNKLLLALLERRQPQASAAPVDPLAGVKLGAEMTKAAQPVVAPAPAPASAADPLAQMRGTIELVKEMQGLAPAGGGGAAEAAEVSTIFNGLTSLVNGLKTGSAPAPEPPPPAQTKVLINGRYLTPEQAALEYSRLSGGPPAAAAAPAAPPPAAPAPAAPVPAVVVAPSASAPMPAAPAELDVDAVLERLRDPVFAEKFRARVADAQAAPAPSTPPSSESARSESARSESARSESARSESAPPASLASSPAPAVSTSSGSPPSCQGTPPTAVASALASMPRELVGHVATLDPGQFVALAKMHPDAIARSVRGLQGMDDEKARNFGEAIGNLPTEALPLLSQALPAEARKFLGLAS